MSLKLAKLAIQSIHKLRSILFNTAQFLSGGATVQIFIVSTVANTIKSTLLVSENGRYVPQAGVKKICLVMDTLWYQKVTQKVFLFIS